MPARKLDSFDHAILRLLQDDAGRPQREIADSVNLSAPAVQRRIARMEADGVIKRTVATVEPAAVGYPITVLVEATLTSDRSNVVAAAAAFFREAEEVLAGPRNQLPRPHADAEAEPGCPRVHVNGDPTPSQRRPDPPQPRAPPAVGSPGCDIQ